MNRREAIAALLAAPAALLGIHTKEAEIPIWGGIDLASGPDMLTTQIFTGCRVLHEDPLLKSLVLGGEPTYTIEFIAHPLPDWVDP